MNWVNPKHDCLSSDANGITGHTVNLSNRPVPTPARADNIVHIPTPTPVITGFEDEFEWCRFIVPCTLNPIVRSLLTSKPPFDIVGRSDPMPFDDTVATFDRGNWRYTIGRSEDGLYFVRCMQSRSRGFVAQI